MGASCHNTTQAMKLLSFVGTENLVPYAFLCYMQKCSKICYTLNTLCSNYSLLQFAFNFMYSLQRSGMPEGAILI